jgi:hypothetical protein
MPTGPPVEEVVPAPEDVYFSDLVQMASTSTDFWDNPWDDEDWDNVPVLVSD